MEYVVNFVKAYGLYLVPISISILLVWFLQKNRMRRMMMERAYFDMHMLKERGKDHDAPSPIKQLLQRNDVSLRVIEEVYEEPRYYRRD